MKCTTADYKPGFPSGQRGWTQDPLRKASQVRILPPAPFFRSNVTMKGIQLIVKVRSGHYVHAA